MSGKSSVSGASSYRDIGAFWDRHDATEWGEDGVVDLEVAIVSERRYVAVDGALSERVRRIASRRGVSEETLVNEWIREMVERVGESGASDAE